MDREMNNKLDKLILEVTEIKKSIKDNEEIYSNPSDVKPNVNIKAPEGRYVSEGYMK